MGHSIVECELLTGTRSAEGIMASGPVSRIDRPNTWLLRPALRRDQSLDSPHPSTHGPSPKSPRGWRATASEGRADFVRGPPRRVLRTQSGPLLSREGLAF